MRDIFAGDFVLDCSVTMAWFLSQENRAHALKIRNLLKTDVAIVPTIWCYEVSNVLCMAEKNGQLTRAKSKEVESLLEKLPIKIDMHSTYQTLKETHHLAKEHGITVYDAAYLELAIRENVSIATFDNQLAKVADALGIRVL